MKVDLHCHTNYSFDCKKTVEEVLQAAQDNGLDAIAITDHNTTEGAKYALSIQDKYRVKIIVGQETRSDIGDIIGLFIDKTITAKKWEDIVREIREQDGLVLLPHPLVAMAFNHDSFLREVDLIEGFNPRYTRSKGTTDGKGEPSVHHIAEVYNLKIVANSDSHDCKLIGSVYTRIEGDHGDLKKALMEEELTIYGSTKPN